MKREIKKKHTDGRNQREEVKGGRLGSFIGATVMSMVVFFVGCSGGGVENVKHVALTQITSHESLDAVRDGVIEGLRLSGYEEGRNLKLDVTNAQGDMGVVGQIARRMAETKVDVAVAIATPSAQACLRALKEKRVPLVFATVTDPIGAKLVSDLRNKPNEEVSGTINISPIRELVDLMMEVEGRIRRVGLVVNYGEANSVTLLEEVERVCKERGLTVKVGAVESSQMVGQAAQSIVREVDCFVLLQDNTVASALPALLKVANQSQKPVFSTYSVAVERGAVMGLAYDEFEIGVQSGKIAARILDGEAASTIAVEYPKKLDLSINEKTVNRLKLKVPEKILKRVNTVYQD